MSKDIHKAWFDDRGYFQGKNCASITKYIKETTGVDTQVHFTGTYVVIMYVKHGEMKSFKIRSHVIYILKREHFTELLDELGDTL